MIFIFFLYLAIVTFKFFVKRGIISGYTENYRSIELDNLKIGADEHKKYLTPQQLLKHLHDTRFKGHCYALWIWSTPLKNLCKENYLFCQAKYTNNSLHLDFGNLSIDVETPELISVAPSFIKVQKATKVKVLHSKSDLYFTAYPEHHDITVHTNDSSILPKSVNYEAALFIQL